MPRESTHLDKIMDLHNRTANLQVVFVDIEKYSQRRTLTQIGVIDSFTECLRNSLNETSKNFIDYAQSNEINFQNDIIKLPTGDGAAIIFSFDGLHDIHLNFAISLLNAISKHNAKDICEKFEENGWCNCHPNFNVRIGISEGKGIIFKDLDSNYNVAGSVINFAARVMSLSDSNQIIFTEESYRQIIDMVDDPFLYDHFQEYKGIRIKHDLKVNIYQYTDKDKEFINSIPPDDLLMRKKAEEAMVKLSSVMGVPFLGNSDVGLDKKALVHVLETIADSMSTGMSAVKQLSAIEHAEKTEDS